MRSVAVEIRVYENKGNEYKNTMPLVAGRTVSTGGGSLASSKELNKLFKSAVNKVVKSLNKLNNKKNNNGI